MTAIPDTAAVIAPPEPGPDVAGGPGLGHRAFGRRLVLGVAAVYFLGPLLCAIVFTLKGAHGAITLSAYREIFRSPGDGQIAIGSSLLYSLEIAVATIVITLVLMVPTQLLLHLQLPRWRGLVEVITLLPLVFPPVVLVVGVSDVYAWAAPPTSAPAGTQESTVFHVLRWLRADAHPLLLALLYVILAMPFVYRSIDAGLRAVDLRTLVDASTSLGAWWTTTVLQVVVPCLRTAIVNSAFLCFALVMGEYTIASVLLYTRPFPVWLAQLPTTSGQVQAAVSVFSLLLVEIILLVVGALNLRGAGRNRTKGIR